MALSVAFQYYHILCRMVDLREMTPEAIECTMVHGLVFIKSPAETFVLSKQRKQSHHAQSGMYRLLVFVATGLDPKTLLWLEEHTMSVEIFKDDRLHKIHFPVQIRVRTCTLASLYKMYKMSVCAATCMCM